MFFYKWLGDLPRTASRRAMATKLPARLLNRLKRTDKATRTADLAKQRHTQFIQANSHVQPEIQASVSTESALRNLIA